MAKQNPIQLQSVGFPDFWETAVANRAAVLRETEQLVKLQNRLFRKPVSEPLHQVLRLLAESAANSFGAVVVLSLNGYGSNAMRIARGIFEADLVAGYLRIHPEEVADFRDYSVILRKRQYDYMRDHSPNEFEQLDAGLVSRMQTEYSKIAPRLRRRRKGWTNKSLEQMAQETGLSDLYKTFYAWASSVHHLDIVGLSFELDQPNLSVVRAPSEKWLDLALNVAHGSLLRILLNYNEAAELGLDNQIQKRIEEFKKAWSTA